MKSPRYSLTRSGRGWYKRVNGQPKWIVSAKVCPTPAKADRFFEQHFGKIVAAPRSKYVDRVTVMDAADIFVTEKEGAGLHPKTVSDYDDTMIRFLRCVGESATVSSLSESDARGFCLSIGDVGAKRRQKHVVNARHFVRWLGERYETKIAPAHFIAVTKREIRRDPKKIHHRPYTANQIRRMMMYGSDEMRRVILLGLNLAIGPDEMASLTYEDIRRPTFTKPRSKNGIPRLAPIWPETRRECGSGTGLIFAGVKPDALVRAFKRLCIATSTPDTGHGIYNLRRTFRTVADEFGDQRAAAKVMGRELPDQDTTYVLTVKVDRIASMLDHVKSVLRIGSALRARRVAYDPTHYLRSIPRRIELRKLLANPSKRSGYTGIYSRFFAPESRRKWSKPARAQR